MKKIIFTFLLCAFSLLSYSQTTVSGVITYYFNQYQGNKPDLGASVTLRSHACPHSRRRRRRQMPRRRAETGRPGYRWAYRPHKVCPCGRCFASYQPIQSCRARACRAPRGRPMLQYASRSSTFGRTSQPPAQTMPAGWR